MPKLEDKPFGIPRLMVWEAWRQVKANKGAPGVDGQDLDEFEADLKGNLYKIWNRMSSGSYFPPAVRAVEVPKPHGGGVRLLGVPTVADRVAQTVVAMHLGGRAEPRFHPDSYGYRPGRSAHDALEVCRARCWKYDWAIDLDVQKFFDEVPWDLIVKAVRAVTDCRWVMLCVKRWLAAPLQYPDGILVERDKGTPQGSAVSPIVVNLLMHVCPQGKRGDVEGRFVICAVPVMEVGPPGSPCRRGAQTTVMSCRSKAGVGSDYGNGSLTAGQVFDEKTNVVEPLQTHRKTMAASQPGLVHISGRASRDWVWCSQRTACVSLWGCSVLRWRELVVGAGMEEENLCLDTVGRIGSGVSGPLAARGRTLGGRNRSGQSTARRRGGPARSSDEGPVMGLEPRGRAGQLTRKPTRWLGRS
jgi:Reverse transcriptase (RNA-dependent DNA polymerase)